MPFVMSKLLDHGTSNPIVARLSLQTMQILDQCKIAQETRDKVAEIYIHSLQKKLLRCWEIEERFRSEFNSAAESYKPSSSGSQVVQLPQIPRLDEECHNFLYEMKNYVCDLLKVFNRLYGTAFDEASEFFRAKQGCKSLIEFAASAFGRDNPKTKFLEEAVGEVERVVKFRNAVEHPGGYSGELRITNFALEPDGRRGYSGELRITNFALEPGQVADIEVGAFLIAAGNGPEKQELLRLIGTLVRAPAAARS